MYVTFRSCYYIKLFSQEQVLFTFFIENPMIFSVLGQLKESLKYVTGTNEEIQKYVNKFFSFAAIYTVNKGVVVENWGVLCSTTILYSLVSWYIFCYLFSFGIFWYFLLFLKVYGELVPPFPLLWNFSRNRFILTVCL